MKLSRLELYGFKSFPRRTTITFDDGITGIVGPNGSGKSNIADAMRWVLGEQSAKALRGAKMEDVIFAGTQTRKMMPYCEVSLVFDNADGTLNDLHSEVMVTRRVYRSGEGEYSLNKKPCRLKDIVALFQDTGIGQEGYSLIGQGHIDEILSSKGEERRAAFEEAAGIAAFRSRKEEALRKLKRTEENLARVSDLVEELSGRLIPLKEQSQAAQQYIQSAERLKALDINIFLWRHDRLGERMSALQEKVSGMRALIAGHEAELEALKAKRSQLEQALLDQEMASDSARGVLEGIEAARQEHLLLSQRRANDLEKAREEGERLLKASESLGAEYTQLSALAAQSQAAENQEGRRLGQLDAALMAQESALQSKAQAARAAEESLEAHRSRMLKAVDSLSGARENKVRQQMMLDQAIKRRDELSAELSALEGVRAEQEISFQAAKEKHEAAAGLVEGLFGEIARQEEAAHTGHQRYQEMVRDLSDLQSKIRQDESRHETLKELSQGLEGYFHPVRQALKYAGNMPKVRGVLAQLITVPKEMENAIEMLLGNALQNIVTDDEETAQRLIDYLRENKLGRTTFLPISAIKARTLTNQELQVLDMPGCLGVASDLVKTEPRYRPIVESLLGRAVVTRTLDEAIPVSRAGRQAFHVVTLKGDVMRAGGAMTGGATAARSVSLLGREREMKELAAAVTAQQAQLEIKAREAEEAFVQLQAQDQALAAARAQAQDEEIGLAREEERVRNAKAALEGSLQRLAALEGAIAQLEATIKDVTQDLSRTDSQAQAMETDQAQLQAQEAALKNQLAGLRGELDAQREKADAARAARQELSHQLNFLAQDRRRLEKELARIKAQQEKAHSDRQKLSEGMAALLLVETEDAQQQEALEQALAKAREETAALDQKRRQIQQAQKQCNQETENLHQRYQEDSLKLHRSELSTARLEDEQLALTNTLWNSYEMSYAAAEAQREELDLDLPKAEKEAAGLRQAIKDMGPINIHAIEDYAQTKARYDGLTAQQEDAHKAREDLIQLIDRLQTEMEKQFVTAFDQLNAFFGETFKRLFSGGQARLSLSDPEDPLGCDILIEAQPPGKKLQLLSLLSGGERALTAIAILFAMLELKPTPFCVLDEIEAALDDANIVHFADYLAEYARETQFIVVTHRKGTMARCDALYGVTMREKGVSDMISVSLQDYPA
ncbi:MAG: chromosome segregation protein SMC [Clostridiales bacterium]|nr:chromosome segregation protein SMC [Clostridiales bacterium]